MMTETVFPGQGHDNVISDEVKRQYACRKRDEKYSCASNVRQHELIHTRSSLFNDVEIQDERYTETGEGHLIGLDLSSPRGERSYVCEKSHGEEVCAATSLCTPELTRTGEQPAICHNSVKTFRLSPNLLKHVKHNSVASVNLLKYTETGERHREEHLDGLDLRSHSGERSYVCESQGEEVCSATSLRTHELIHTGEQSAICHNSVKSVKLAPVLHKHVKHNSIPLVNRPFVCALSEKVFGDMGSVQRHEPIRRGEQRPYACGSCDKSFLKKGHLRRHEHIHTGDLPFGFNKRFNQDRHLHSHEPTHSGDRPFVCKTCGFRYTQAGSLHRHELSHVNEHRFKCETCDRSFDEEVNLRAHELSHSVERVFVCATCDKSFTQSGTLRRHERIHTGQQLFICGNCDKRFTREENLTRHMFIHSGERPYACTICNVTFTQVGTLRRHERIHSGERAFDCKKCSKKCYGLSALRAHQYSHTRESLLEDKQPEKLPSESGSERWRLDVTTVPSEWDQLSSICLHAMYVIDHEKSYYVIT